MIVFATLDRALARAVTDEPALLAARDEWNRRAGVVHDDEALYEERAAAFLDWFTLERRDPAAGVAPVEKLIAAARADSPERAALVALATSHRSLFRVRERSTGSEPGGMPSEARGVPVGAGLPSGSSKASGVPAGAGLLLEDIWGGGVFRARERRTLAGVERGDLLDARLCADVESPPDLLLTRIVCVHPREAEAAMRRITAESRAAGEPKDELLFRLLRLRVRCERYRHVAPARVYEAGETR